jgi:hypothetical protein
MRIKNNNKKCIHYVNPLYDTTCETSKNKIIKYVNNLVHKLSLTNEKS